MMNLIQKFLSKDFSRKQNIRKNFSFYFFSLPEHQWLLERSNLEHFEKLFSHLPVKLLEYMMMSQPIVFIPSDEVDKKLKETPHLKNMVIVFPEFQKILKSNDTSAVAYLAHEIAFILLELETTTWDPIAAEIEADKFVSDLGLTYELEKFLLMLDETIEKRLRLTYLTCHHFKDCDIF